MNTSYIKKAALALFGCALAATVTSCSDDDNWTPGEQVADGVTGAYFDPSLAQAYSTADDPEFSITVSRLDTTQAATVKVSLVSADTTAISVPETVTFEKGKATAQLVCRAEGLLESTKKEPHYYSFTIELDSAQANPYAAGTTDFTATVVNGSLWLPVVENALFYFGTTTAFPSYYSDIEQFANENRFRIKDFMGSGVDFEFNIQSASESKYYSAYTNLEGDVSTWCGSVEWDGSHLLEYDGWLYFSPDTENEVYGWSVPGSSVGYASLAFYPDYTYIDFSGGYLQTWAYGMLDDADYTNNSEYFYGYWTK